MNTITMAELMADWDFEAEREKRKAESLPPLVEESIDESVLNWNDLVRHEPEMVDIGDWIIWDGEYGAVIDVDHQDRGRVIRAAFINANGKRRCATLRDHDYVYARPRIQASLFVAVS